MAEERIPWVKCPGCGQEMPMDRLVFHDPASHNLDPLDGYHLDPSLNRDGSMAYIARKTCGCVTLAIVDVPGHINEILAAAIRRNEIIEHTTTEHVRKLEFTCITQQYKD